MSRNKNEKSIEDAAIRLAANAYVEKEGEKIIEEANRLNQEKKVSDEQLAEFERLCSKEFAKQEWKSKLKQVSKVAVAAVAVFVFVSGIHQFRMTYNNSLVDEKGTTISGNRNDKYPGDDKIKYAPTHIPEGYVERNVNFSEMDLTRLSYVKREKFIKFYYQTLKEKQSNATSDNDNAEIIDINGSRAKVTRKPDENIVKITWEKGEYIFCVEAQGVDEDEVIKVAESVQRINEE